jgi:putative transposase
MERVLLTGPKQVRSTDFVADASFDGCHFRALTIVDNFINEGLVIGVNQNLEGEDAVTVMERLGHQRDLPQRYRASALSVTRTERCKASYRSEVRTISDYS